MENLILLIEYYNKVEKVLFNTNYNKKKYDISVLKLKCV